MNYLFLPASSRKPGSIWANCFSGLFGGFGLAKRGNNFQFFFGGILLQLYELRFNTKNLPVVFLGAFPRVKYVFHSFIGLGIKNFSFLLSKSPIRFCPENSIRISRRAKRGEPFKLAISSMVQRRGIALSAEAQDVKDQVED